MTDQQLVDLVTLTERPPPLGGQGWGPPWASVRSRWEPGEAGRPRIVHSRVLHPPRAVVLHALELKAAHGYHKCGSGDLTDRVERVRIQARDGGTWRTLLECDVEPGPVRLDLDGARAEAVSIDLLRSELDGEWTPFNLAEGALRLLGTVESAPYPQDERRLRIAGVDLDGLPEGVTARRLPGEVRYRTATYEVGFRLGRPGFAHLSVDEHGLRGTGVDLLRHETGYDQQAPMLHPVGGPPAMAPSLRYLLDGETRVEGNAVTYRAEAAGQRYEWRWRVEPDGLVLDVERSADADLEAWESNVWQVALDSRTAISATIGALERTGRTGAMTLPLRLHAPGHGTFTLTGAGATWRSDADRPRYQLLGELKLGEEPTAQGTSLLRAGTHRARVEWRVGGVDVPASADAPQSVRDLFRRTALTGLTTRPDTGTLSNNAVSMHCPMTMDTWARLCRELDRLAVDVPARDWLRWSVERWLDGGPGYASGRIREDGETVAAEDDYLITGVGAALGMAHLLEMSRDADWLDRFAVPVARMLAALRARDLDGDGLIESPRRRGVSGEHRWSTNWYDVVGFGWKDAWVNAVLYDALVRLARVLPELGHPDLAEGLAPWAEAIREAYAPTFLNPETGWVAGWRSSDGALHDHAFPIITGVAVASGVLDETVAAAAMAALWAEYERVTAGLDGRLGIPTNLWPIPDEDLTEPMHGFGHGFYLNGALSSSQSRHLVEGLYRVGMRAEGDALLERIARGLADGLLFGGSRSGVDWRWWDGEPCGYEGLLTEQFGIVGTALERYGRAPGVGSA